jgi:hypothetical protein
MNRAASHRGPSGVLEMIGCLGKSLSYRKLVRHLSPQPGRGENPLLPPRHDGQAKTRRLFCPTSQGHHAKILFFPKYRIYDLTNPSRLDTRDVMAIRHQT